MDGHKASPSKSVVERSPWWVPWVFVLIVILAWMVLTQTAIGGVADTNREARIAIRDSQVDSCGRVNVLRGEINQRSEIVRTIALATAPLLIEAGKDSDAERLISVVNSMETVDIVDCDAAFPEDTITVGGVP